MNKDTKEFIEEIIFDAAISKAFASREILKPSIEYYLSGKGPNGMFRQALLNLMRWTERKVVEAVTSLPPQSATEPVKTSDSVEDSYWQRRCEAAELLLKKYYKNIPDCPEYQAWQNTIEPQLATAAIQSEGGGASQDELWKELEKFQLDKQKLGACDCCGRPHIRCYSLARPANRLDLMSPGERIILESSIEVEKIGAHEALTTVVVILNNAREVLYNYYMYSHKNNPVKSITQQNKQ